MTRNNKSIIYTKITSFSQKILSNINRQFFDSKTPCDTWGCRLLFLVDEKPKKSLVDWILGSSPRMTTIHDSRITNDDSRITITQLRGEK